MQSLQPIKHSKRDLVLQTTSEQEADGQWSASFAVFDDDRPRSLVYWMPSLFRTFRSEHEADDAAMSAGLEFIEKL